MENREFKGFSPETTDFFHGIKENNNRSWFEAHKQDYLDYALTPARLLAYDLSKLMLRIDPEIFADPLKIISRIYRDIRFSRDKSPYKSRLFLSFKRRRDDWMDAPGFYFEVDHESYGFGMGIYDASTRTMRAFREAMSESPAEFLKATAFYRRKDCMFRLGGHRYVRPPAEQKDKRLQEWFMMKNFYLYCDRPADKVLYSPKLETLMAKGYKQLVPFYRYLWKIKARAGI